LWDVEALTFCRYSVSPNPKKLRNQRQVTSIEYGDSPSRLIYGAVTIHDRMIIEREAVDTMRTFGLHKMWVSS
jgi:hypothetical protein